MSAPRTPGRSMRLLAILALPLAIIAAFLSASTASAGVQGGTSLTIQVWTCPTDYAGEDYLTDCTPGPDGYEINTVGTGYDIDGTTDVDGFVDFFGIPDGSATAALGVPGDFARFYFSCFDTSSGSEVFLFDGDANAITFDALAGDTLSCRWYVIPEDASGASPSPSVAPVTSAAQFQVWTCPVAYAGDDYLTDCDPVDETGPVDVLLSGGPVLDPDTALVGTTGSDGFTTFTGLISGTYTAGLDIPGEFATFYLACFDATSGSEVFLFDGATNVATFELTDDSVLSCRWYVIPEDLQGGSPSPSASATTAPTSSPAPSGSSGGIVTLPSTGTGSTDGTQMMGAALVAAVLAVVAVAFATRRLVTTRA